MKTRRILLAFALAATTFWCGELCATEDEPPVFCAGADTTLPRDPFLSEPDTGTYGCVVIFCAFANAIYDTLAQHALDAWDTTGNVINSVADYYDAVSRGKHRYKLRLVAGADGKAIRSSNSQCHWQFEKRDTLGCEPLNETFALMAEIMAKADSVVDFGEYDLRGRHDNEPDGYVDRIVFVVIGLGFPSWVNARGIGSIFRDYEFNDTNALGQPVKSQTGHLYAVNDDDGGRQSTHVGISVHEFGHNLGLQDRYYYGHVALGSFCGMTTRAFVGGSTPPYSPSDLLSFGWIDAAEISEHQIGVEIEDIFAPGNNLYRLSGISPVESQHFLVSYHNRNTFWDVSWPKEGVLIWHVDDNPINWRNRFHKPIDIEWSTGLYELIDRETLSSNPAPTVGSDSLDLSQTAWLNLPGWGSGNTLWHSETKSDFHAGSNPSSGFYYTVGGWDPIARRDSVYQDYFTQLAVMNIQVRAGTEDATADLYPARCSDGIWESTTLSGTITISNELYIPPGVTVTISAGTVINVPPGDIAYCVAGEFGKRRVRVEGTLIVNGTPSSPVTFRSTGSTAEFDDWQGIVVMPGGHVEISNAVVKHAVCGIDLGNDAECTIEGCVIDSCLDVGIRSTNPNAKLLHNTIYLVAEGSGLHIMDSCTVLGTVIGDENNVQGTPRIGILAENSNAVIDSTLMWTQGVTAAHKKIDYGIIIEGRKSSTQPLLVDHAKIHYPKFGIQLNTDAFARINNCRLYGVLELEYESVAGINDVGDDIDVKVRGTIIEGFRTGVHTSEGMIDLGVWDGVMGGHNSIYPPCFWLGCSFPWCCHWEAVYNYITTDAVSGTIMAEDNRWTQPCSTMIAPDRAKIPAITDFWPIGAWDYASCSYGGEPKLNTTASQPLQFELSQNRPNPFNPRTEIQFTLPVAGPATIAVYNLLGQRVITLLDENRAEGVHSVSWDGTDELGRSVASGIYFYEIRTDGFTESRKMLLLK